MVQRIVLLAVGVVLLVAVAPEAQGKGGVAITGCGQTVTTSAILAQNLTCSGPGVIVGASNLTIDLQGLALTGDRMSGHQGIDDTGGFDNIQVRNGLVRNFNNGIEASGGADHLRISRIVTSGNTKDGIEISGASADVQSASASGNGFIGIAIVGDSALVKSSEGSGNGDFGIEILGDSPTITASTASGNLFGGITVFGKSATVKSSRSSGNGHGGIFVDGEAATLKGNQADGNGFQGNVSNFVDYGIHVDFITVGPVGRNTAVGNDNPAECFPSALC